MLEPHATGLLDVGDGHRLYWECCGNPEGAPALVLHGGPGSGCTVNARRPFDPTAYRIILFDQRNSGRSLPHASAPGVDLAANTTVHLLADIERLRTHLGVARWLVFGASWGATLALAYAQRHPQRVRAMVLASVATTSPAEIAWITRGLGAFFPEAWERFRDSVPPAERDGDLATAFHRLLMHPDPAVHEKAARAWCDWEQAIVAATPGHTPHPRYADPAFRLGFARVVTHYWSNRAWLEPDQLIRDAACLAGIPGTLIHGRLDLTGPLHTPWRLARAWPGSRLQVVETAGHDGRDPGMAEAVVAALDRLRPTVA